MTCRTWSRAAMCVAVLFLVGCASVRKGWRLPFDSEPAAHYEGSAPLNSLQQALADRLFPPLWHESYAPRRPAPIEERVVMVPPGGTPVSGAFTLITEDFVSREILGLRREGILALTDGDELLCANYRQGVDEWLAVFARFDAGEQMLWLDKLSVFADRARCVERYKRRRADELSVRQMDWVIDRLDYLNGQLAEKTGPPAVRQR